MDKKGLLVLFVILIVLLFAIVLFAVVFKPIKRAIYSSKTINIYGKRIYKIARDNDYLLLNNFDYKLADGTKFHIDHILFGEKYIYVFKDVYFDGGVSARENDNAWVYFHKNGKKQVKEFVDSPLKRASMLTSYFSQATRLSPSFFKSIALINDDCAIEDFKQTSNNIYLSTPKKVNKLIENIEKTDIKPLNQKQLEMAVKDIATRLNINYNPKNK